MERREPVLSFILFLAEAWALLPNDFQLSQSLISPIKPSSQKLDARETDLQQMVPGGGPRISQVGFWSWLSHQMAGSEDPITGDRET